MDFLDPTCDLFGGAFDFNGDGKMSVDEEYIAYKIFEDCCGFNDREDEDDYDDGYDDEYDDYDDYSEADYLQAAEIEATRKRLSQERTNKQKRLAMQHTLNERGLHNKRQYNAFYRLIEINNANNADEHMQKEAKCCQFIIENAKEVIAAKYLTPGGDFLYGQAIKEKLKLPISLCDEDEERKNELVDILRSLAQTDIPLCLRVWLLCIKNFMPYCRFDDNARADMTNRIMDALDDFPPQFPLELIRYMGGRFAFRRAVVRDAAEISQFLPKLILMAERNGMSDTAVLLFKDALANAGSDLEKLNMLTDSLIYEAENYEELESIEYIEKKLLPLVRVNSTKMNSRKREIAEYKKRVERDCEKYAYSRGNAWRKKVPDGEKYGLDPLCFESESDYLAAYNGIKYIWRKRFRNNYGIDPADYEEEDAFIRARTEAAEQYKKQAEQKRAAAAEGKDIFIYCGVLLPHGAQPYSFRTEDTGIDIGDSVIVEVGDKGREVKGTVVSVGRYIRDVVPYPIEKTKLIIRKCEKAADNK